ncbi:hypothetical protein AUC61_15740 [Pseudomonas sp. S25]|uniref:Methyl-accepting chemotaxis protein n=1 Tax=Pseudomonas maioricensis TaxID=1766623 RepID=A0ABS9ZK80_9PSED|nr:hypothetical protein [Pseudomonas sp. S25]MCI8210986.1 hypothetical protein [Pseudomonas sp. S25]
MPMIARWALQGIALFLFAWMATMAGQWSSKIMDGTRSDRLAIVAEGALMNAKTVASNEAASSAQ